MNDHYSSSKEAISSGNSNKAGKLGGKQLYTEYTLWATKFTN